MRKKAKHSMPPIRVYDFFSGCGGTSVGFRQAGIEHALAIDSCPDSIVTFQKNFPGISVIIEPLEAADTAIESASASPAFNSISGFPSSGLIYSKNLPA